MENGSKCILCYKYIDSVLEMKSFLIKLHKAIFCKLKEALLQHYCFLKKKPTL